MFRETKELRAAIKAISKARQDNTDGAVLESLRKELRRALIQAERVPYSMSADYLYSLIRDARRILNSYTVGE